MEFDPKRLNHVQTWAAFERVGYGPLGTSLLPTSRAPRPSKPKPPPKRKRTK
jgi:hypothetical protein